MPFLLLLACSSPTPDSGGAAAPRCDFIAEPGDAPTSEAELQALLDLALAQAHPELAGVPVSLQPMDSESDYFTANLDLTTIDDDPRERLYFVNYSVNLFPDPPPYSAVGAILVHELKHVLDYTGMDTAELGEFGIWYATTDDISEYERATDEYALAAGCGEGLIAYREWLYAHVDEETAAQKRLDYYTPEEIAAWMEENG